MFILRTIRLVALAIVLVAVVAAARGAARERPDGQDTGPRYFTPDVQRFEHFGAKGSELGVSIRDVEKADVSREKLSGETGAVIDEVRSDSAAAKAGIKAGDVVIDFDGERVRSARQLSRLVEETPGGRMVKMAVMRGGQRVDLSVTPAESTGFALFEGGRPLERLERFAPNFKFEMPEFDFDFDFDMGGRGMPRLGVSLSELTPQLSTHFGVKDGVLVTAVTEDSPAASAGIKAGDVITSINGRTVTSASDVRRAVSDARQSDATAEELTIVAMRDRKEVSVKAKIERPERSRRTVRRTV